MIIFNNVRDLRKHLDSISSHLKPVGFVPTMGALHAGHLSLISKAKETCNLVIASIFVNPTQFNDKSDLARYPRTPEKDADLLAGAGCDIIFMPTVEEVYPQTPEDPLVDLSGLDTVMEGKFRPGHFKGVVMVVKRLFEIVKPDKAFFGEKDFQQLSIIRKMVKELQMPVEIIGCPIFREAHGLAMSSRNELLNPVERSNAGVIYSVLRQIPEKARTNSVEDVIEWVNSEFNNQSAVKLEYFSIVDPESLQEVSEWPEKGAIGCFAGFVGKIRLIDNIFIKT